MYFCSANWKTQDSGPNDSRNCRREGCLCRWLLGSRGKGTGAVELLLCLENTERQTGYLSRYSDNTAGWTTEESEFDCKNFTSSGQAVGPIQRRVH